MELTELRKNWNAWGETDPLWAIVTNDPEKRGGGWELGEFFATGEETIDDTMRHALSLGVPFGRGRALDFGCGVGRLTQPLCRYFEECHGVDIARSMIRLANTYNRHRGRCHYHLNETDDLRLFADDTFDFVHTCAVLQHMQPRYAKQYVAEFLRILAPGGLATFDLPSGEVPTAPLPASSYRARITPVSVPGVIEAGAAATVRVRVRNESAGTWPAHGLTDIGHDDRHRIQLGNHWIGEHGNVVVLDDGRAPLTVDLGPGEEIEFSLDIRAPQIPGPHILELDMVHEGVAWFQVPGSPTARVPVHVLSSPPSPPAGPAPGPAAPIMEMYCVPKDEVLDLIGRAGGQVVAVTELRYVYVSHRYVVTR